MLRWWTVALWLLLAFVSGALPAGGTGVSAPSRAPGRSVRGSRGGRGKFSSADGMECAWSSSEARGVVQLKVKCENPKARVTGGVTELRCEYNGKPSGCSGYRDNSKGFWKQVNRALRRLERKLCSDKRALVKASMCKDAPRDAHFKLDIGSSVAAAQSGEPETLPPRPATVPPAAVGSTTPCTRRADHQKAAEEYCSSSWASVCAFFFSMVQSEEC